MKKLAVAILLFCASQVMGTNSPFILKIRLFSTLNITSVDVIPDTGAYYLIALDRELRPVDTILDIFPEQPLRQLQITHIGKNVAVKGKVSYGSYHALLVRSKNPQREFRIETQGRKRVYNGDVQIRVYNDYLQVVNIVNIEDYVAGVVESEGGREDNMEYFKAQAVLARTFALRNLDKHIDEGYNLKDDVTSQVYFSRARYQNRDAILEAVACTRDTIVVTDDCDPILSVFYANSGGYTCNAQDVWQKPISYLCARPDSFSVGVGSYEWEKKVSKSEFYSYYAHSLGVSNDLLLRKAILNFSQDTCRRAYFTYKGKKLKLTHVRSHFNLRSTFFDVEDVGQKYLILRGKGYGHGVGMSQDGAMEMDRRGYSYRDIIHFYFTGVELEDIENADIQ